MAFASRKRENERALDEDLYSLALCLNLEPWVYIKAAAFCRVRSVLLYMLRHGVNCQGLSPFALSPPN